MRRAAASFIPQVCLCPPPVASRRDSACPSQGAGGGAQLRLLDVNILVLIIVTGSIVQRDYWEATTIVFLFTISERLESRASHKATAVMTSLVSVVPRRAVVADTSEEMNVDEVKLNTILAVKAGEVIPIDGVVVEGSCEVDEKILTGESFPGQVKGFNCMGQYY